MVGLLHRSKATTGSSRPVKITLGAMRETGVRDLIVFCADYKCSHNIKLAPVVVDQWSDDLRLSDLETRFVCQVCGKRGAILRAASASTMMSVRR
jgi:hypothetical protein